VGSQFTVKVKVGGATKFSGIGQTESIEGGWDIEAEPGPGGWTNSIITLNGKVQLYKGVSLFKDDVDVDFVAPF